MSPLAKLIQNLKGDVETRLTAVHNVGCFVPSNSDYAVETLLSAYNCEKNELIKEEILWAIGRIIDSGRQKMAVRLLFFELGNTNKSISQRAFQALSAVCKDDNRWLEYCNELYEKNETNPVLQENFEKILEGE